MDVFLSSDRTIVTNEQSIPPANQKNLDGKPITFLRGKNSLGPKTKIKLSVDTSNPTICPDITGLLSRAELQETTQLQEIGNKSSWINIILPNKGKSLMGKVSLNLY